MRTPKENKQKLRDRTPKSTAGTIPKAALKAAWLKTKEQTRTAARENDTDTRQQEPTDLAGSAAEQSAAFVRHQGRKLAETQARQHRQKEAVARAHAAGERGVSPKQTEYGTMPDAAQRPRRGADLPRQRAKEKAITAKTAPRDIRGVTQGQRQLHTAANETVRSVMTQAQMQTHAQKIRLAVQKAVGGTGRTAVAVHSAIRNFLAELHSFITVLAAGAGAALGIVIVICLVAFVSGSAYGIFFAADAPNAASVTVREAVETLTEEYRDRLEEISDTVQHDRQDICVGHLPPPTGGKTAEPSATPPTGQGSGSMKEQAARQQGAALQKGAATEDRQEKTTAQAAASAKYREDGVPQQELERFARFLLPKIQAFYQSEEGQRLFEEWINRRNAEEKTGKCKGS